MQEFFTFFGNMWIALLNLLDSYKFSTSFGEVSIWSIIASIFFLGFITTTFFKGSKT